MSLSNFLQKLDQNAGDAVTANKVSLLSYVEQLNKEVAPALASLDIQPALFPRFVPQNLTLFLGTEYVGDTMFFENDTGSVFSPVTVTVIQKASDNSVSDVLIGRREFLTVALGDWKYLAEVGNSSTAAHKIEELGAHFRMLSEMLDRHGLIARREFNTKNQNFAFAYQAIERAMNTLEPNAKIFAEMTEGKWKQKHETVSVVVDDDKWQIVFDDYKAVLSENGEQLETAIEDKTDIIVRSLIQAVENRLVSKSTFRM